ncbi:DUF4917 family protein [Bradyrhizobium manausense]|uniref:DUF4917 family protein n=1 Tax=Bradyrhizobium manausense TaxID=989370 RepID=UPI001BA48DE7|nr:DUF4917 family protein [Bradyrhizobium manausense]MBR0686589.1 DUF4917 family protein [Bradyrhizobium manausense]
MTISFDEAIAQSDGQRSLLIGNGFSIAQSAGLFSYANLLEKSGLQEGSAIKNVFAKLNSVDFELVMYALEHASKIEEAYGEEDRASLFKNDASAVREALIHAVRQVHPKISVDVPQQQRERCSTFLRNFDNIFTVNYDLLLYWVILHIGGYEFTDGFGLGSEEHGFRTFSTAGMCNTFYLHGALHLFLGDERATQKRVVTGQAIVDEIADSIRRRGQLPLFVAEGSTKQKMERINSVPYLRNNYDRLKGLQDNLFVYGHSVAENDYHLYDAIFASSIRKLFFCVYQPDENLQPVKERLAQFCARNEAIEVIYVDSATAHVW